jgi:hypothetical protein
MPWQLGPVVSSGYVRGTMGREIESHQLSGFIFQFYLLNCLRIPAKSLVTKLLGASFKKISADQYQSIHMYKELILRS